MERGLTILIRSVDTGCPAVGIQQAVQQLESGRRGWVTHLGCDLRQGSLHFTSLSLSFLNSKMGLIE